MKFLIFLACVSLTLAVELTDEQKKFVRENAEQCTQQEGNTKEQAVALRNGNFEDSDPKVKCFANCIMEKIGFVVDGQLKPEVVIQEMGPIEGVENVRAYLIKCASVKGADKCDTGYQLYQCIYKNRPQK